MILGARLLSKGRLSLVVAAMLGGLMPDVSMFVMFLYAVVARIDQSYVWDVMYESDPWMSISNFGHSYLITGALLATGFALKNNWLKVFGASAVFHAFTDFALHSGDGHYHFWPLSNWEYISPVSYWDPEHYGWVVLPVECLLVIISSVYLWKKYPKWWLKVLLIISCLFYIPMSIGVIGSRFFGLSLGQ